MSGVIAPLVHRPLAPAREHLDRRREDLGLRVAAAEIIVPLTSLQPALDGDLLALAEILGI
jgi:hypothetical protein